MKSEDDRVISITDDVMWVGILDYDIRTFDIVMTTEFGTTYNSYFINAKKKAIIEVAKEKFGEKYLQKLRSVTDPREIEYIILDHTEPDHSGSLRLLLEIAPSATVVGSGNAIRYLEDIVNVPFKSVVVKDGDNLDLGNKTLKFISAPLSSMLLPFQVQSVASPASRTTGSVNPVPSPFLGRTGPRPPPSMLLP